MRKVIWGIGGGILFTIVDIGLGLMLAPFIFPMILNGSSGPLAIVYLVLFPYPLLSQKFSIISVGLCLIIFFIGFWGGWQFSKKLPPKGWKV